MSQRATKILTLAQNADQTLLFLPKYETTKGLEKSYQERFLNIIRSKSSLLTDVYGVQEQRDTQEMYLQCPNIKQDRSTKQEVTNDKLKTYSREKPLIINSHLSKSKDVAVNNNDFEVEKGISELKHKFGKSEVQTGSTKNVSELDIAQGTNNGFEIIQTNEVARENIELLQENQNKAIMTYDKIIQKNESNKPYKNKKNNGNKISILQNIQIKAEEKKSEAYLPVRKASQRQKTHQQGYADTYDSDEIEEPFQSSGSEYLPSDEEGNQLPFIFEPLITDNEGIKSKEIPKKYDKVQDKKSNQNEKMPRKECNANYDCNEISVNAASSLLNVKQNWNTSVQVNATGNVDRFVVNFGKFVQPLSQNVESNCSRSQNKKTTCSYCLNDVTHFPRHLIRNHGDEGAVKEWLSFPPNHIKRKTLLDAIRRQGNYVTSLSSNNIRPVRRPKETDNLDDSYVSCPDCMGFFRRNYLSRHRKQCSLRTKCNTTTRENHLSIAQVVTVCSGAHSDFLSSLRLKQEVFPIMRNDKISKTAMNDMLICSYAESLLRKHKRTQIRNVVSNKMRELGRFLITLGNVTGIRLLFDALRPQFFDNIIGSVRVISGYCEETKTFKSSCLALHMGTTVKQVCDIATKNIIKKSPIVSCTNAEEKLKDIKRLRHLIENHWSSEISSLALKNLKENNYSSPKLLPLTQDVVKFQKFVMKDANEASNELKKNQHIKLNYRKLAECVFALTLLINRKRIGEIQYLKTETYNMVVQENQQSEFLDCLSIAEKTLCKNFKRVVTGGKRSRPVAILFPPDIQEFIALLISFRSYCVPETNPYLFGNPNTDGWLSGYHIVKKLAEKGGVSDTSLFTSTRLRKQIATVLQAINIKEDEMEQFATFMGHTKETHRSYYRLPQDVYQTAKVSKLINNGNAGKFKGKSLDEITLSEDEEFLDDTYDEKGNHVNKIEKKLEPQTEEQEQKQSVSGTSEIKMKTKAGIRGKWSSEQKKILKAAFKEHIKNKKAPRKEETELFMKKHGDLYKDKSWVTVKAFIYNSYKDC